MYTVLTSDWVLLEYYYSHKPIAILTDTIRPLTSVTKIPWSRISSVGHFKSPHRSFTSTNFWTVTSLIQTGSVVTSMCLTDMCLQRKSFHLTNTYRNPHWDDLNHSYNKNTRYNDQHPADEQSHARTVYSFSDKKKQQYKDTKWWVNYK